MTSLAEFIVYLSTKSKIQTLQASSLAAITANLNNETYKLTKYFNLAIEGESVPENPIEARVL